MPATDPRVDAYIAKAAPFAQPILEHLRKLVHTACPEVVETVKWGFPNFEHHGLFCHMAAFKAHCAFGFWKGELILGKGCGGELREGMGRFGKLTSLADLPSRQVVLGLLREAVRLNVAGVKKPGSSKSAGTGEVAVPDDLAAALREHPKAQATFTNFSPSQRREYVEWITEAKREETRRKRLATTLEWLAEGKRRYWKYASC